MKLYLKICLILLNISALYFTLLNIPKSFRNAGLNDSFSSTYIKNHNDKYQLFRDGSVFFIDGAAGTEHLSKLKEAGGNSFRTWDTLNIKKLLDSAKILNLNVTIGLNLGKPREGFDYNNKEEVLKQRKRLQRTIVKYKDHPAVLSWGIGNEIHIYTGLFQTNYWKEINEISKMIHAIDPNHPTTTMVGGLVPSDFMMMKIKFYCSDLDFLSINAFHDLYRMYREIRHPIWGWEGPYLISEWSGTSYWTLPTTEWGAPIEPTTTEKARQYYGRPEFSILLDKERCIGGYVFYWGEKQERTHTMFSMFADSGKATGAVDMTQYIWTGKPPVNWAPFIDSVFFTNHRGKNSIYLKSSTAQELKIYCTDGEGDSLKIKYDIRNEGEYFGLTGGDKEPLPPIYYQTDYTTYFPSVKFTTPDKEGPYRIFVYIKDTNEKLAVANFPFYIIK